MIRPARELGVEFAFPTQTLYMRSESWSTPEALAAEDYPGGSRRLHDQARQAAHRLTCTGESD